MKMLKHLRSVERAAYPAYYCQMQAIRTMADLHDYCEGKPKVWTWDSGYCIITKEEIVDLASTTPLSLAALRKLIGDLAVYFKGRIVSLDAREETSWKLIQYAARRGYLEIISSESYDWAGETFYESKVRFN